MFSFFARKQAVEIAPYLRRICDRTAPNNATSRKLERVENRYNRTLPVLIWPWKDEEPVADQCVTGVTKDLTDHGIGVILSHPVDDSDLVIGLLSDESDEAEPWFFRGQVVRRRVLGAGYWLVGMELVELLNKTRPDAVEALSVQAGRLLPTTICGQVT